MILKKEIYKKAYHNFVELYIEDKDSFSKNSLRYFSAPGRTEICGNHTDHQLGCVLAGAVDVEAFGVVKKREDNIVRITSLGYDEIIIHTNELEKADKEKGTTQAIIKGVLFGLKNNNYNIGGFDAYIISDVIEGAGLSSSAAFENLIGSIVSGLYNEGKISPIEIAKISQFAENEYFGKPCGLMDQMASAVGGLVYIDFKNKNNPKVKKLNFDIEENGYCLCITDTLGSHADLTDEYAAIPGEMKSVANFFGQEYLRGIDILDLLNNIKELRKKCNDRAILRAIHFISENERVMQLEKVLEDNNIDRFLDIIKESGDSSYKYLQNIYSVKDVYNQNISLALATSQTFLEGNGISRIHGGGFAGTIQAFVKKEYANDYKKFMDSILGEDVCHILHIRNQGATEINSSECL